MRNLIAYILSVASPENIYIQSTLTGASMLYLCISVCMCVCMNNNNKEKFPAQGPLKYTVSLETGV